MCWNEMQVKSWMLEQPAVDGRRFVSGVVVQNQMHLLLGGHSRVNDVQEMPEFLGPVTGITLTNDLACLDVQRRKERGGAVPLIIGGPSLCGPGAQRQDGLSAVQRLNLALFVNRKNQRAIRRA